MRTKGWVTMSAIPVSVHILLRRIWLKISYRRKLQFSILLGLIVASSFAEFLNIGAVLPFLSVLVAPDKFYEMPQLQFIIKFFNIKSSADLVAPVIILFGALVVFANFMRLVVVWASVRLSSSVGADLSIEVYKRTLYQPYIVHVSRNSSDVINVVTSQVNYAVLTITMLINLLGSLIMLVAILIAICMVDPIIAFISLGGFGAIYLIVIRLTRKKLNNASHRISIESARVIKILQEGLGGIRDVLLDGNQETYSLIFHNADTGLRRAQGNIEIMSFAPRYGVETLSLLLILAISYFLVSSDGGVIHAIPILGALALGAQRMLPVVQLAYVSLTGIRGNKFALLATLELLDQALPLSAVGGSKNKSFNSEIKLEHVRYKYPEQNYWVLDDVNLIIRKGERVGFIGKTGSGKSTLLDLIMGLLEPTQGKFTVDGVVISQNNIRGWQKHLAHVPQYIYLSDNSIEENIAFGIPKNLIDVERVKECAAQAQISEMIDSWPLGYQTPVGERGVRLSGGQRQRIGIARALYKNASVIIFDEATSALDGETEDSVINAIDGLGSNLTILMIAHRLTTLKGCSKIIELKDGVIANTGSYQELALRANLE